MFRASLLAAGLLAGTAVTVPLAAAPALSVTVPSAMPLAAVGISEVACRPQAGPAFAALPAIPPAPALSARLAKSAAILGGQMSALERMRMAQSGVPISGVPMASDSVATAQPATLTPLPSPANATACAMIGARPAARIAAALAVPATGQFLGTERVRIGRTRFDSAWERVTEANLSSRDLAATLGTVPRDRQELVGAVNRWVNREIRYRDDRVQFGTSDYWADARSTLRSRRGDCEDYAILKMQLLAAAGLARDDMMLTLARDTIQRTDHAVLLVRMDDEWVMLDMASDRIAPAAADYGYRPVMSFAATDRFIHGTAVGTSQMPRTIRVAIAN